MKTHYKLLIGIIILLQTGMAMAQVAKSQVKVSGTIFDNNSKVLPFATVALLKAKDSSVVKGAITNDAGLYSFDRIGQGSYIVRVTTVGFLKAYSKSFAVAQQDVHVPSIQLSAGAKALGPVNVNAARPLIERKLDRMVMNVENSVLAAGNDAMEILERAPGVTIDKDDNISLKGKQGVTVMINDKPTRLSASQLATLLRSTDGNNIQSIEVITNPSAKYDAAGNSGIINIILKKNNSVGTNGSISATGAIGIYPKGNASLSLNHKEGNLNFFGSYSIGSRQRANNIYIDRVIDSIGKQTYFTQHTFMPSTSYNNTYRLGVDYDMGKKNTIGFLFSGYYNGENDNNVNNTVIGSKPGLTDSLQNTTSTIGQTYGNYEFDLYDKFHIDSLGQDISIDIDYAKFTNTNNALYNNYYFLGNGATQHKPLVQRNQSPSNIQINTEKIDYTLPFNKNMKFEAGLKSSYVKTDNNLQAQLQDTISKDFVNDGSRTNHFIYEETVTAGYINLAKTYKKTQVQIGLRLEDTHSIGNSLTTKQIVDREYTDLFPSIFINHSLSAKHDIGFSYSRRIDRPQYDNLNPFQYNLDAYTYSKGNPFLNPQYTHSFQFDYTYAKFINASISYSHTDDVISQIILPDNGRKSTYQTTLNLNTQDVYNININSPFQFAKWWTGNANINANYLVIKSKALLGGNLDAGAPAAQIRVTQNFQLNKTLRAELSTSYNTPQTYAVLKLNAQYWADMGISQLLFNKAATLKFSVSDIFDTRRNAASSLYQSLNFAFHQKGETRVARLTFTYNFGNSKIKARQHSTGAESEKSRVNGGG
ncbi:TonB-dependent receptor family protein [Mucilaginibacter sp. HMF5004]|uniref:outer membrane beta-barrel family protein n=1 Tax=Mucilaginibacter rivuli TaxID=2857527 RepID=UPI001C601B6B|nr:outer membrane beta-barrel family protein [Mucilaginibacter rivuli]MBW4890045.1 TonB-dependent receptor family protein [Mucilaginibacter rivuli]